ncbi:MAG: hypothetical protein K4305_09020 [Chlorobium sp.]|uniref:hypothetical protein n=1 Tax=Chlorobium sp. TaxID=1095 RepID=UPI002F411E04
MSSLFGDGGAKKAAQAQIKAAKLSADAIVQSTDKIIAFNKELYEDQKSLAMPWYEAGKAAIASIQQGIADGSFDIGSFRFDESKVDVTKDPGYQFRLSEGLKAIDNSAAAKGNLLSGGQLKRAAGYAGDLASQEYDQVYDREYGNQLTEYNSDVAQKQNNYNILAGLSGSGQTANSAIQSSGTSTGGQITNALGTQGTALANMYTNIGNANANYAVQSANNGVLNNLFKIGSSILL